MARNWTTYGAYLGFGLAAVALVLLAISPLGWREGWWHFRFAFTWLMPYSGYIALTAAVVSLLVLAVGWSRLGRRGLMLAGIGLAAGAVLAYVPWQYDHRLKALPRIHDITTDTENPPTYVAALPTRAAENAAPATNRAANVTATAVRRRRERGFVLSAVGTGGAAASWPSPFSSHSSQARPWRSLLINEFRRGIAYRSVFRAPRPPLRRGF